MQCCGINNRLNAPYSTCGSAWAGDRKYDFSVVDRQMEMFLKFAPDGYFMLMPVLDMPEWWRQENNCGIYKTSNKTLKYRSENGHTKMFIIHK